MRRFLDDRLLQRDDPREIGAPLAGEFTGLWRYRVGDIRILARIEDDRFMVLVIAVRHRREVYR